MGKDGLYARQHNHEQPYRGGRRDIQRCRHIPVLHIAGRLFATPCHGAGLLLLLFLLPLSLLLHSYCYCCCCCCCGCGPTAVPPLTWPRHAL
jgi:hypothetical protein